MLVQCKQTGRELEMFYIKVPEFLFPEAEKVLKRYSKGSDEKYEVADVRTDVKLIVVVTERHRNKIISKLIQQNCLSAYEDF